jgi:putative transcriptional regulator
LEHLRVEAVVRSRGDQQRDGIGLLDLGGCIGRVCGDGAAFVERVRKGTGLSQDKFAAEFGLAVAAVRAWEQNLRTPDLAAQTLLRVIESYPDAVRRAVRAA